MKDGTSSPHYVSYLLRMWRETGAGEAPDEEDQPGWRASVVSTLTGRRQGFANLDDLCDFLRRQEIEVPDGDQQNHPRDEGDSSLAASET